MILAREIFSNGGTTFDVRGSGASSQILLGSTAGNIVALLTSADGVNFTSKVLTADAGAGSFGIGLVFGQGSTMWGKAVEGPLALLSFDAAAGTASTINRFSVTNFPATIGPIGVQPGSNILVGINITTPDTVNLYNISDTNAAPVLLDSQVLPTDFANSLYMGAVDFGPDMVFVLDSNNGLAAYNSVTSSGPVAPSIIAHPKETQTIKVGRPAAFTVYAAGTAPLAYQWSYRPSLADPPHRYRQLPMLLSEFPPFRAPTLAFTPST